MAILLHYYSAPYLTSPIKVSFICAGPGLRTLTFNWNQAAISSGCSAIHYNINASNCGSCPTTTSHISVTCTDVPTDDGVCIFAVQVVVCGNILVNTSDTITIDLVENSGTVNPTLISTIVFATALVACVIIFMAVIIKLIRVKTRVQTKLEVANGALASKSVSSQTVKLSSVIDTNENVAYGVPRSVSSRVTQQ